MKNLTSKLVTLVALVAIVLTSCKKDETSTYVEWKDMDVFFSRYDQTVDISTININAIFGSKHISDEVLGGVEFYYLNNAGDKVLYKSFSDIGLSGTADVKLSKFTTAKNSYQISYSFPTAALGKGVKETKKTSFFVVIKGKNGVKSEKEVTSDLANWKLIN